MNTNILRLRAILRGAVQGVGFRPFVFRLAVEMKLPGWVSNSQEGVLIEVEGRKDDLDAFAMRLNQEKPIHSFIQSQEISFLDPVHYSNFEIRHSDLSGASMVLVLPDIASCLDCVQEIFDPENRRYRYPFTNCTNCGPRFTIIESLPYDRPNTSMKAFRMCNLCKEEYENPLDRRFHAQPNACPDCGPHLELWNREGKVCYSRQEALEKAVGEVRSGKILAFKGLGGFHLIADARNQDAVIHLRERKHREEKPFAVMYPNFEAVKEDCEISTVEGQLLQSSESPIVILRRKSEGAQRVASHVAPDNPYLGAMLPYTPLHHLFMKEFGSPVVATSGNLSDEPICTNELEALDRLRSIADLFLVHDRPILRHVDDSIVRVVFGRPQILRRARGYAPLPIQLSEPGPAMLAVGGHLKNTVALRRGPNVFVSQHIGDLETMEAFCAFQKVVRDLKNLYPSESIQIVCDLHPDYFSSRYAHNEQSNVIGVQHHYAHVASCMAENELDGSVLGVSWDGTGYGLDRTIWGGEFLLTNQTYFERVASLRPFGLPGGSIAIREPARTAMGVLYEIFDKKLFQYEDLNCVRDFKRPELEILQQMLVKKINTPQTTSAGRLFDAVASILNIRHRMSFEGQAAMELEFAAEKVRIDEMYDFDLSAPPGVRWIDWEAMILGLIQDLKDHVSVPKMAAKFHNTLTEMIVHVARDVGEPRIVLTGGCFQNRYLTERTILRLEQEGFRPYWHQRVPPNDGGLALGQVFAAIRKARSQNTARQSVLTNQESTCV